MRIAVANAGICASKGGAERASIRLATEMLARGHDTRLLTVQTRLSPQYRLNPLLPVHFFPSSFFNPEFADLSFGIDLVKKYDIQAVIGFESDAKHVLWGQICGEARIPYICSERNSPLLIEQDFWNPDGRRAFLSSCTAIHELLPVYLNFVPEEYRKKSFIIPNAAPDNLPPIYPGHNEDEPVLLFLGRFARQKRLDLLIRAFALLAKEFPRWRLRLAGWGEEEEQLNKLTDKLNLKEIVEIRAANPDVSKEYMAASVYCLPSLHEGFPNTVLEAMGHGLPVVGFADCLALRAIIKPGQNGFLAPKSSPEALAETLRPLFASASLIKNIGEYAWQDCRNNYSAKEIFDLWEKELLKYM